MKKSLFFVVALLFSATAFAASAGQTKSKMDFSKAREQLKGFSVVGFANFAGSMPTKIGNDTVQAKSNTSFGIGAEYKKSLQGVQNNALPISVIGGLVFETPRDLKEIRANGQSAVLPGADPSFSLFTLYGNLSYRVDKQVSIFGGMNFPLAMESNFGDASLSGTLGGQLGVTIDVARSFSADLIYRNVNLRGTQGLNSIDMDGLIVGGRYIF